MDAADVAHEREAEYIGDRIARQLRAAALDAPGSELCSDCSEPIPLERRRAVPSAHRCVECQAWAERTNSKRRAP